MRLNNTSRERQAAARDRIPGRPKSEISRLDPSAQGEVLKSRAGAVKKGVIPIAPNRAPIPIGRVEIPEGAPRGPRLGVRPERGETHGHHQGRDAPAKNPPRGADTRGESFHTSDLNSKKIHARHFQARHL